jgi:hypothetical protein
VDALEFASTQAPAAVMTVAHAAAAKQRKLAVGEIMTFILVLSVVVVDSRCDEFQVICSGAMVDQHANCR